MQSFAETYDVLETHLKLELIADTFVMEYKKVNKVCFVNDFQHQKLA